MQNRGAIKFLTIIIAIACLFQLSFTFVTQRVEKKAKEYANGDITKEQNYLDSMKSEVVYNLGIISYNYDECKEKEINLGLDLKGGMNVTLEIGVEDVLRALANHNPDPDFNKALAQAREAQKSSSSDFITLFDNAYRQIAPNGQLVSIFNTYELRTVVTADMSNDEIIKVLRKETEGAIENSYKIIRNRIDRFGVTQPNVQRLENSGRILVELPGIKEPERVLKLLQGSASLEFWATYDNQEIYPLLNQINQKIKELKNLDILPDSTSVVTEGAEQMISETAQAASDSSSLLSKIAASDSTAAPVADRAALEKEFPLFSVLSPIADMQRGMVGQGPVIGRAMSYDTAKVNAYFAMPQVKAILPRDLRLMWGTKADEGSKNVYSLYAIKANTRDGRAPLDGGSIVDAKEDYQQGKSDAEVSMTMNSEGARIWARLTSDNKGYSIAIVLDGYVYSAPRVHGEITGGRSSITGNFTIREAQDLANVLKSGKLPAPARVIQYNSVGPSLGKESIEAGMMSFILAFILVLLYMQFFYSAAGLVANVALIANLFFLFGVLVSFGAVLTLPGIAGIVLTMGMAVDANVIIYERIKEEIKAGKPLNLAVPEGYKHALSAIIDGNMTTLITGIVLYIFGTGPVQGFATTLIIGIITSLFCSIFITRLIFEGLLAKGKNIKFYTNITKNFLANTRFDFINIRKVTYVISIVLTLVVLGSFATSGMSYGVDFSGGRAYVVRFDRDIKVDEVREALQTVFEGGCEVKQFGTENQVRVVTKYKFDDDSDGVNSEISSLLYKSLSPLCKESLTEEEFITNLNPTGILSSERIGPTIAHDIKINSIIAIIFSLLAIGLYIALRFKHWEWAMGGVISLAHDALLTVGVFSLLWGVLPFNMEVDQSFIAAILTIIGYSINDTVVIFDRIREYIKEYPKRGMKENINNAINSTLARTVNTAGTTIVVLLAIFLFGGEVIRGFVFALMFGVIIGTFSSVFVATPVAYDFMRRRMNKKNVEK